MNAILPSVIDTPANRETIERRVAPERGRPGRPRLGDRLPAERRRRRRHGRRRPRLRLRLRTTRPMGQVWIGCDAPVTVTVPGHVRKSSARFAARFVSRRSPSRERLPAAGTVPGHGPAGQVPEGLGLSGLEVLFEAPGLPAFELPAELAAVYGGSLGFEEPRVFANFVSTLDGVVAIPSLASSNKIVAGGSAADRFAARAAPRLLRRAGDRVGNDGRLAEIDLDGGAGVPAGRSGVRRAAAAARAPAGARGRGHLRQRAHRPRATRRSPPGAIVLTTDAGAARLAGRLPDGAIVALGRDRRSGPRSRSAA